MLPVLAYSYITNKNNYSKNNLISFKAKSNLIEQRTIWNNVSTDWADCKHQGGNILQQEIITKSLLQNLSNINGSEILDAGCGEGFYSRLMSRLGARVVGVDFSKKQIEKAKKLEDTANNGIRYINESVTSLRSIKSNSMDKVVSVMLTMYLDDANFKKALEEFNRVLKSDGELIILTRHPFTTRKKDELKLAGSHEYLSSYFSKQPFDNTLNLDGKKVDVKYYPRTMSEIVNGLVNTGFALIRMDEPKPGKSALLKYKASASLQYYSDNPMAIVLKAKKIASKLT